MQLPYLFVGDCADHGNKKREVNDEVANRRVTLTLTRDRIIIAAL
jgi:hypothetical protein